MQISEYIQTISQAVSGKEAYGYAGGICAYNRIPLSGGYDEAAEYCAGVLQEAGVESRVLAIPLEKGSRRWAQEGFDGWTCRSATLRITGPVQELLCDAAEIPTSLIQRSRPASLRNAPVIMLDRGSDPEAYADLDLQGAVVFAPDAPHEAYRWATARRGAAGIITDYIPPTFTKNRALLPDARSYFSFFWQRDEAPCFGFVITPRQGDALRELCRQMEEEWQQKGGERYPLCDVEIEAENTPGCAHVVEAFLPGSDEEEIIITAHLCHARPSANDNASGCAGAMAIMTALHRLLESGQLPPLNHGIRMLLVPEVSGTFAYLAAHEARIGRIKAAINLDMIGRRQEGRSGMLGIWATPDALPSFIIDLMAYVRRRSDREAPTVGVPCITFMQWMDQNYHTSSDVLENLDPEMLHKSAAMAACWAYALASPDLRDLPHAFAHMRERFQAVLHMAVERKMAPGLTYGELCAYETDVFRQASDDALRFYGEAARPLIRAQEQALRLLAELETPDAISPAPAAQEDTRIPRRNFRGPLSFVGGSLDAQAEQEIQALSARYPGLYGYHSVNQFILFRVDGRRTVSQIARLVGLESRYYSEGYVSGYLDVLARCGVISFT